MNLFRRSRVLMETDEDELLFETDYGYEDLTFLEACMDGELDAIAAIVDENPTEEEINERDKSGRTGLAHLCLAGLTPGLDLLTDVPEMDVNLPDKEGNTPLIFASQAGFTDAVRLLLSEFKGIRIDQPNRLGMTALMKSAIQGRTDCSRLLLYAGADPKLRDTGRKLCAEEWAAYCGRRDCADAIAKFSNTKSFYLKSREAERCNARLERSNSLPDMVKAPGTKPQHKRASLRKKIKKILPGNTTSMGTPPGDSNPSSSPSGHTLSVSPSSGSPFAVIARCVSTPVLPGAIQSGTNALPRPVSAENIPRVEVTVPPREDGGPGTDSDPGLGGGRIGRSRRRLFNSHSMQGNTNSNSNNSSSGGSGSSSSTNSGSNNTSTTNSNNAASTTSNTSVNIPKTPKPFAEEYVTVT